MIFLGQSAIGFFYLFRFGGFGKTKDGIIIFKIHDLGTLRENRGSFYKKFGLINDSRYLLL
jgi:hypothetical protein